METGNVKRTFYTVTTFLGTGWLLQTWSESKLNQPRNFERLSRFHATIFGYVIAVVPAYIFIFIIYLCIEYQFYAWAKSASRKFTLLILFLVSINWKVIRHQTRQFMMYKLSPCCRNIFRSNFFSLFCLWTIYNNKYQRVNKFWVHIDPWSHVNIHHGSRTPTQLSCIWVCFKD